jgi:uncharacterized tellurite resistance protein B-like protein
LASILSFLGVRGGATESDSDTIRRIAADLDALEPDRARHIAAFAFVLSRVAHVDERLTDDEVAAMERLVRERGHLPDAQAVLVVQMARTQQALFGATDDFLVTRELSRVASYEDKVAIVDCLFAVASADGRILVAEANEIGRIARELRVEQSDLSRLRNTYRDFLAVRQGSGEER